MSYFWKKANGVNADLIRHKEAEIDLLSKIKELETRKDDFGIRALAAYREFLCALHQSKAEVVSKIGRGYARKV
jgi:hypothetical protein